MIFVTVGTHEQPFNRLIEYIDRLKEKGILQEEVVIQTGYSTYEPEFCQWKSLFPYQEMVRYVKDARIVITHGGPSSFIMPLQMRKIPIVVPRQKQYNEHVNDHQLEFAKAVAQRQKNIIVIERINELKKAILNYDSVVKEMAVNVQSNNSKFMEGFNKIVETMMEAEKK